MHTDTLTKFYELADDIKIATMTTRRPGGHLRSRAMANQKRADGADLWFVTSRGSDTLLELAFDPHVNLSYSRSNSREWISISGSAETSQDRAKIRELYSLEWKMWFPNDGDSRHGTAQDPRVVLIGVTVHAAEVLQVDKSEGSVLYVLDNAWLTSSRTDSSARHTLALPRWLGRP